ncbi:serine-type D-Ala-D-Ala carboxypeptidase [Photobacterium leiognathi]|uniref:serine-type D-Ala-D-Ala carboxypeptidase n=1 Tax=Photobacterium leiognathi TaxID=553611 RepID=UPI000D1763A2|nr:serine-type D-Ala-D-Ala carboxypeptidase [Photobacterium leiognathi]PSW42833.1 serine-type D-Ala-D-Ala carboxypeptidase [Photobacterium leiognathi subsp. mandapamensis]
MFKKLLCSALMATSFSSFAAFSPQQAINQLPKGSDVALLIVNPATNKVIYDKRADELQAPASTQKTITALAAKLYLGNNFRFDTNLETKGNDVILKFNGDPTLKRSDIANLLRQLKQQGVTTIKGNLYLNGGHFTGYERAIGWPWDILGSCYSAPSSSISLEHNCVQGALYSNKSFGDVTRVNVPSHQPIKAQTSAIVVSKAQQKEQHCQLSMTSNDRNMYTISGCIQPRKEPLPLKFAVQNTTLYSTAIIQQELKRAGIKLNGKVLRDDKISGKIIATHRSAPLSTLLDIMLKRSDNLFADNIAKTIGAKYYNQAGSYTNGIEAIKAILKDKAGIDLSDTVMVDGSGLSRNNRLTASDLMKVVTYIYRHPQLGLMNDLPVSGKSGTLQYRRSIRDVPLKGKIIAKSGSLFGTYNLAGVMNTQNGKPLLFVQLVTNYYPHMHDGEKAALPPIYQFEKQLYNSLYKSY